MNSIKARAIVLKKVDFSETSQVARLITDNSGKINVIARGARRLKSSFGGALDYMNVYEIFFIPKSPDTLDILTYSCAIKSFRSTRRSYERFAIACHCLFLCDTFCVPAVPQPDMFNLIENALELLNGNEASAQTVGLSFACQILRQSGYAPRLTECGTCHTRTFERSAFLVPSSGGIVCRNCVPHKEARMELEFSEILSLKKLFEQSFPSGPIKGAGNLFEAVDLYMQFVTESRIKTSEHVRKLFHSQISRS